MRLLLDTHTLLWAATSGAKLSTKAARAINSAGSELYLSAASVWELAIKIGHGKLNLGQPLESYLEAKQEQGIRPLPVDWRHAAAVRSLPNHHQDPFDRLLIAQAQVEGLTIVSCDPQFPAYGVPLLW